MDAYVRARVRIGILGGSFNPIHNGHLLAADIFAHRLALDRVLLLPSIVPFYKRTLFTDYAHRLTMCDLACTHRPICFVSDLEHMSPGGMYTCDVVKTLRHQYENADLFLLMGSDVAYNMPRWKGITDILHEVHLGIMLRPPYTAESLPGLLHTGKNLTFLTDDMLPLSSTMVRKAAQHGFPLDGMVPHTVARYISDNYLYSIIPPMAAPV